MSVPEIIKPAEGIKPSQPLPATTTEQEDLTKSGQRNINLIWEHTQAKIALICVWVWLIMSSVIISVMLFAGEDIDATKTAVITTVLSSLSLTVGIVIGFYFSRTNHTAIGGVGKKPASNQEGGTR